MIFANVTDIKIPQGSVIKIHETNSGRIIWQKKNNSNPNPNPVIENGYPRIFIAQKATDGNTHYTQAWGKNNPFYYSGFPSYQTLWRVNDVVLPPPNGTAYPLKLNVGTKFTAYYVNSFSELQNYSSQAKKLTDASWSITSVGISAAKSNGNVYGGSVTASAFFSLSSSTGSEITVTSIKNNFTEYINRYETYGPTQYYPKTSYPLIMGTCNLKLTSAALGIDFDEIWIEFYATR